MLELPVLLTSSTELRKKSCCLALLPPSRLPLVLLPPSRLPLVLLPPTRLPLVLLPPRSRLPLVLLPNSLPLTTLRGNRFPLVLLFHGSIPLGLLALLPDVDVPLALLPNVDVLGLLPNVDVPLALLPNVDVLALLPNVDVPLTAVPSNVPLSLLPTNVRLALLPNDIIRLTLRSVRVHLLHDSTAMCKLTFSDRLLCSAALQPRVRELHRPGPFRRPQSGRIRAALRQPARCLHVHLSSLTVMSITPRRPVEIRPRRGRPPSRARLPQISPQFALGVEGSALGGVVGAARGDATTRAQPEETTRRDLSGGAAGTVFVVSGSADAGLTFVASAGRR